MAIPNPQLLPLALQKGPAQRLKAWAVRVGTNTPHILLINKGSRAVPVSLDLPATGPATAQQLLARSARATSGVTLAGQHLDARGRWVGKVATEMIGRGTAGYPVTVRGLSATLVTVTLRASALTATRRR